MLSNWKGLSVTGREGSPVGKISIATALVAFSSPFRGEIL